MAIGSLSRLRHRGQAKRLLPRGAQLAQDALGRLEVLRLHLAQRVLEEAVQAGGDLFVIEVERGDQLHERGTRLSRIAGHAAGDREVVELEHDLDRRQGLDLGTVVRQGGISAAAQRGHTSRSSHRRYRRVRA
jgi:hypothetical protein